MLLRRGALLAGASGAALLYRRRDEVVPQPQSLVVTSHTEALDLIDSVGFCVLRNAVGDHALRRCTATSAYLSMPTIYVDSKEFWHASAFGRYHRVEFDAEDVATFAEVEQALLPLVERFFGVAAGQQAAGAGFYRSELQLLTAVPMSDDQIWHSDNRSRGLTLLVPLVDFHEDNGPTQILPGSHIHSPSTLLTGAHAAVMPRGSAVAYDARAYHRGLGNKTAIGRPALVFRYDAHETPPPGVGPVGTVAHTTLARVLHAASGLLIALGIGGP